MIGVYFSGTGNTEHCIKKFILGLDGGAKIFPLENKASAEAAKGADEIVFAYPVYYSNLPKIVRDFICENSDIWRGKRVFYNSHNGSFQRRRNGLRRKAV